MRASLGRGRLESGLVRDVKDVPDQEETIVDDGDLHGGQFVLIQETMRDTRIIFDFN